MPRGFDTTVNCGALAPRIRAANYDFIGRYYSNQSWKALTVAEAQSLSSAGLQLITVWEENPIHDSYFSHMAGLNDATSAYHAAQRLGQPAGSAIYFAVDYDAERSVIDGAITEYFRGIADGFVVSARGAAPTYDVGIYGSGATCAALLGAGLARYAWLAQSTGWAGANFTGWHVKQAPDATLLGIKVDLDEAKADYGAFALPAPVAIADARSPG